MEFSDKEKIPAPTDETRNYSPVTNDAVMGSNTMTNNETVSSESESELEFYDIKQQSAYKSAYEKQREKNIEEKNKVMAELGIFKVKKDYEQAREKIQTPTKKQSTVKRTKNKCLSEKPPSRRMSQRLQTRKLTFQNNEDEGDTRTTEDTHERKAKP